MSEDGNARSETPDIAAVAAVATEYLQYWCAGDGDRMCAVLHPALSKRTPEHPGGPGLTLDEDTAESMSAIPRGDRARSTSIGRAFTSSMLLATSRPWWCGRSRSTSIPTSAASTGPGSSSTPCTSGMTRKAAKAPHIGADIAHSHSDRPA
jgi:hypothetical protein